MYDDQPYY